MPAFSLGNHLPEDGHGSPKHVYTVSCFYYCTVVGLNIANTFTFVSYQCLSGCFLWYTLSYQCLSGCFLWCTVTTNAFPVVYGGIFYSSDA
jgi:hypothetical protein